MSARSCSQDCGRQAAQRGLCRPCYDLRAHAGTLPAAEGYGKPTLPDLGAIGISYRQLDWWTTRGWVIADDPTPGSGKRRTWPDTELAIAARMARLVRAGFTVARAAQLARDGGDSVRIGPGIVLSFHDQREAAP